MDPAALLGNFRELDQERRARITEAESLQAQRNRLTQEVARSRKAGGAPDEKVMDQIRELKGETEQRERLAAQAEEAMRAVLVAIPNLTQDSVPPGKSEAEKRRNNAVGTAAGFRFHAQATLGAGREPGYS